MATSYNSKIVTDGLVLCLDAANPKSYSTNVHPYPTNIYSWITVGSNCTLSRDTIQSPVGSTPLKMVITGTDPYAICYTGAAWKLAPAVSGQTWTISCWVKASAATTIEGIWVCEQDSSGNYLTGGGASSPTIGTSWTRISGTYTLTNASTAFVGLRMDGTQTGGTGITVWWDGIQLERTSAITAFNSKTNTNGTNWFDLSGNSFSGILVNIPPYSSTNNGYLTFNGTTQNITTTSVLVPVGATAYTVSVWYNRSRNNVVEELLSQWTTANSGNSFFFGFSSSNVRFTDSWNTISVAGAGTTGTWNNLVGVNTGTNAYIYLNGVLMATKGSALGYTGTGNFIIGNQSQYNAEYFQGSIANVQVYNIALTADQVLQNFNATRGRYGI